MKGSLHIIIGNMASGKSTYINTKATMYSDLNFKCLKIIHSLDERNDVAFTEIGTSHHSSFKGLTDKIDVIKTSTLNINVENYTHLFIDEAQFFTSLKEIEHWVENKHVFVAGLDGDFKKQKFGHILDLIPLADEVIKLTAKCVECLKQGHLVDAPFTKRLIQSSEQVLVGGTECYQPSCRLHH